ncbi:phage major capsid protein [Paramaledivibacter caminithermalis]|uniref:Phage major capsid protein, HK97 family n=1 Tax=Paramaledivibacter caminithermalis (strain DSM 15212 / CIP 107654 / DViRD3) TaxID=1121301 RepID=A0A1M6SVW9_PARC5|nr:phage major capsid protein [Paramaledivibacter caminithermalis]SHK48833.1 phage major capsid protein, HK97 family [Paramaledivibacter caminithermalis DSM 15212]
MKNIAEMKQKRAELIKQARSILETVEKENRTLTDEEEQKLKDLNAEIDKRQKEIEFEERQQRLEAELNTRDSEPIRNEPNTSNLSSNETKFRSFGEQMMAVYRAACPNGRVDSRLTTRAASGLSESLPSDGGFLVQQDFVSELLKRAYNTGVIASKCRKIPLSTNSNGLKINAINESSRANGSRWGGIQTYWENEADQLISSRPKFRVMDLSLKKLTGLCYVTDELLTDAAALESVLIQGFAEEFGFKIDDAIINGNGAGQPLGILNSGALVKVAKETGQAAKTITVENIVKMWSRMWGRSRQNAVWLINQDVEPMLYTLSLKIGDGGVPVYMPANGLAGKPYSTLFGRPVIPIEQCSSLGTLGDIILADFSQYLLIDKGGINAASSIHVRFLYDESVFRFIYRVDGQPIWDKALTPYKGSSSLSPFVALSDRK